MPGVMRLTVDVRCERKVLMKLAAFVFLSTVACAMSQGESWHSSELKFGDLGDFKLENGAVIRDCRIAYHTSGKLNDDKSNVVLWPTWFTGSSKQLIPLAGSDGYVDPSRYFVIFVDALGNGISSSPSNSSVPGPYGEPDAGNGVCRDPSR
jgi:homoserine O-acetyltransferase/O-succinyltransferase